MSKALLRQHAEKAIREKEQQEKAEAATLEHSVPQDKKEAVRPSAEQEMETLRKAVADRQTREATEMTVRHNAEYERNRTTLDDDIAERLASLDAAQEKERRRFAAENAPPEGLERATDMVNRWRNPELAKQRDADLEQRRQQMEERLNKERVDYEGTLTHARDLTLDNLVEGHAQQLRDHATKGEADLERYAREQEAARKLKAELDEQERQRQEDLKRDGPDPPTRAR